MSRAPDNDYIDKTASELVDGVIRALVDRVPDITDVERKQMELGLMYPCDELNELKEDAHNAMIGLLEECGIRALNILTGHGNVCPELDDVD